MELLVIDNGDGAEFVFTGGDVQTDGTFFTAVYISLFLGDCFYNIYTENKSNDSFIEALIKPITAENLKNAEIAASNLLKWLIDEEIAASVDVFAYGDINAKINVEITITEPDSTTENKYSVVWKNEKIYLKG